MPMADSFFERPILNSPYAYPDRHWELDAEGQPTNHIEERRRRSELITPVPKPQKRRRTRPNGIRARRRRRADDG
jgi:type III restriction enzyme